MKTTKIKLRLSSRALVRNFKGMILVLTYHSSGTTRNGVFLKNESTRFKNSILSDAEENRRKNATML